MGVRQKYTEGKFEVEQQFIEDLRHLSRDYTEEIAAQMDCNSMCLPSKNRKVQRVAGVVKFKEPLFFEVEYIKHVGEIPIYISLQEIDVDEYLDYINLNKILSNECI